MRSRSYRKVTRRSWGGRVRNSFGSAIIGLVLFVVAVPVIFWNEGRAIETHKTLAEGAGAVVSVASDRVDAAHAGALVHVTGRAVTDDTPSDPEFDLRVSVPALKLDRNVEMYQWQENTRSERRRLSGGGEETVTTFTYHAVWSSQEINSTRFDQSQTYQNPPVMPFQRREFAASPITLGAFTLPPVLVRQIRNYEPYRLGSEYALPERYAGHAMVHNGYIYMGQNPAQPQIGDTRVAFKIAPPTEVSLVAQQVGDTFETYRAEAGGTIALLETGTLSADEIIQMAQDRNRTMTWVLRGVAWCLMFFGLAMLFSPMAVIADRVRFLGGLVGAGTYLVALFLSTACAMVAIGIAWFYYRPVLAVALCGAGAFFLIMTGRTLIRRRVA